MLTSIGRKVFAAYSQNVLPHANISAASGQPAYIPAKFYDGEEKYVIPAFYNAPLGFDLITTISGNASGVAFGSGTTPPTENDYTIESIITSISATLTPAAHHYNSAINKYTMYIDYVITNNGNTDVVISEICRFGQLRYSNTLGGNVSTAQKNALMDRILLETPVTITPGNAGTVRYELVLD